MKVVLISKEEGLDIGGIGVFNERLKKYLLTNGHRVFELRFAKKDPRLKGVIPIPYYLAEKRTFVVVPHHQSLAAIRRALVRLKPDIVYTSVGISPLDFFLPALCHELGLPIAAVWHGDYQTSSSAQRLFVSSIFFAYLPFIKQLDLLHVFSQRIKDFYIQHGVAGSKIAVIPNGVDAAMYKPGVSHFAKHYGMKQGVLFLGRITAVKNPQLVIRAFLKIKPPLTTKLVIVGTGDLESRLREEYRDPRVIFTGLITDEKQKLDIIRSCGIFVLPSRFEGMSLSLLEAMAAGLTCIVSDVGTNGDVVEKTGFVLPYRRLPQRLPSVLNKCLKHPESITLLGRQARRRAVRFYDQQVVYKRLTAALRNASMIVPRPAKETISWFTGV
jgi:glycosyltransferase involved in cell wall biosynthesis